MQGSYHGTDFAQQTRTMQFHAVNIGDVLEGKPAELSGLLPGDQIMTIDKDSVTTWEEMAGQLHGSLGKNLEITWVRNDTAMTAFIVPEMDIRDIDGKADTVGVIGIYPNMIYQRVGLIPSVQHGAKGIYALSKMFLGFIGKLVIGQESIRNVAGPVGISRLAGDFAREGFDALLYFLALISVNLAVLNLLPIPVLDGGHILLLLVEAVIRRPIPIKVKLIIQQIFMILLLIFIAFVIYNDIVRWVAK